MKNLRNFWKICLILFFVLSISFYSISFAVENTVENTQSENNLSNTADSLSLGAESTSEQKVDSSTKLEDLFLCNSDVTINYPVSGNVYIMANTVTIDNVIDGNVFVIAKNVTLTENAYVYTDLFVCANDITINGYAYDMYAAGDNLNLTSSSYVIRDLTSVCKNCNVAGLIRRNAKLACDTLAFNSSSAKIYGNLNYSSAQEAKIPEGVVTGKTTFNKEVVTQTTVNASAEYIKNLIATLSYAIVIVLIIVLTMNNFTEKSSTLVKTKFWPVIGYGALALFVTPIACLLLLITIIGIWAAIALTFLYAFAISIASILASIALGKLICQKIKKDTKPMVILFSMLIVIALWILYNIPYVGFFTSLIALLIGLGIILYSIFHINSNKKAKTTEENNMTDSRKTDGPLANN